MKNSKLNICNASIHPGEIARLALPLPEQYSCSPHFMPIKVIHGKQKGPCLLIFSVLRGNELNGLEIANRIVEVLNPNELSGTVIAVPVLNVYGLTHFPTSLPDGKNLANCFPGIENGSFGERMAYVFTQELLKKADYCIELQTGDINHNILPQVYCNFDNSQTKNLAKVFQSPVITNVNIKGNRLRQTTEELQIPLLVYQAGEAMRFDENAISLGVNGVLNVIRAINILPKHEQTEFNPIFSQDEEWIIAHKSGILHSTLSLGQLIKKDETIAKITDPFGSDRSENVIASQEGIIVGINTTPLIHEGMQIFKIASFLDTSKAENIIVEWNRSQQDNQPN